MDEVQVIHDGHWYDALVVHRYRVNGQWRAVVRYTVSPGSRYMQARWYRDLRPRA